MTAPDLTIAETQEEIDRIEGHFHDGEESDWSAQHAVSVLKQLLATMQREEKLRRGLEAVKNHQEMVGGSLSKVGTTWHIADVALQSCEYLVKELNNADKS